MFNQKSGICKSRLFTSIIALVPSFLALTTNVASAQYADSSGISNSACTAMKQHASIISEDILNRVGRARVASWRAHQERELNSVMASYTPAQLSALRSGLQRIAATEQEITRHLTTPPATVTAYNRERDRLRSLIAADEAEVRGFRTRRDVILNRIDELNVLPENPDVAEALEAQRVLLQELAAPMHVAVRRMQDHSLELIWLPRPSQDSIAATSAEQLARLQINSQETRANALGRLPGGIAQLRTHNDQVESFFSPTCTNCFVDRDPTYDNSVSGNTFHGYEETTINPATRTMERCYSYHVTDAQFPQFQGLRLCSSRSMDSVDALVTHTMYGLQGREEGLVSIQLSPISRGRNLTNNFSNLTAMPLEDLFTSAECRSSYRSLVNSSSMHDSANNQVPRSVDSARNNLAPAPANGTAAPRTAMTSDDAP